MARGKLLNKRCKNGTRRNKKTKKCEKILNPKAKTFSMKKKRLNPKAKSFSMKKKLNPNAKSFNLETIPKETVSGVVTGIKGMESMTEKAISSLPKMKTPKKSKKSSKGLRRSKRRNPWIAHLSAFRKAHPGMKLSSAMKAARKSYKKV